MGILKETTIPRSLVALFVAICTFFALAAFWVIIPSSLFGFSGNFERLISDQQLRHSISITAILFLISVLFQVFIALLGTLVQTSMPRWAMALLLMPFATGVAAPAFAFSVLFSTAVGPFDISLDSSDWSRRAVIAAIDTWQWIGVLLVAVFSQVNRIPRSFFELADLEGITRWKRWRLIVWPQIHFVLLFYVVFRALDWLRKLDVITAIFNRGPAASLQTVAMYINQVRFESAPTGNASTPDLLDPYSNFLVLLQVCVLFCSIFLMSRPRIVLSLFEGHQLRQTARGSRYRQPLIVRYKGWLFWGILSLSLLCPIVWICSLSLQSGDISEALGLRYHLFSVHPSLSNYTALYKGNSLSVDLGVMDIRKSLVYSLELCSVSAFASLLFATAGVFLVLADRKAYYLRGKVLIFTLSLFFIPPVIAIDALDSLGSWFPGGIEAKYQLVFVYVSTAFVLSFILLLVICASTPRSHFEYLLLETRSRLRAFYGAFLRSEIASLTLLLLLAFSSCWSEFYISDFVTTAQEAKPFSVLLEMNHSQYTANYSAFAAGAVVSIVLSLLFPMSVGATLWLIRKVVQKMRSRKVQQEMSNREIVRESIEDV